jgi:autotransporter-associated beta strand protein
VWRRFRDRAISRVRKRATRDWAKRMGLALLEPLEARAMLAADVATDRFDYPPGSTALITTFSDGLPGPDFQVGETVQFLVVRTDGLADAAPGNRPWLVTDGAAGFAPYVNDSGVRIAPDLDGLADGRITTDWFVEGQYVNASLEIRATGLASGAVAIEQFRDSGYEILTDTTLTSLAPYTAADTITIAPGVTLTIDLATDATFAGTIAGSGSLRKTGAGTLTLSGANTYTGTTRVTQGILELGSPSALSGSTYDANAADSGTIRFVDAANNNRSGSVITQSSLVNPSFEAVDASVYTDWHTDVRGSVGWYNSLNTGGPWNAGSTAPTPQA